MNYVSPKIACKIYGVTDQTLRRWAKEGTIEYINTFGGHHRYKIQVDDVNKRKIIYARVSSSKQKDNLLNQVNYLKNKFPDHELITDIGSGINFKRKNFNLIISELIKGNVAEVVVSSRDRFVRFGYEFFNDLFNKYNSKLTSINTIKITAHEEFVEDIISIITVFTAKYHGSRKYIKNQ